MKDYCKFCGLEIRFLQPRKTDYFFRKVGVKYRKPTKYDYDNKFLVIQKVTLYDKNGFEYREERIIAKWIAKNGQPNWNIRCECGKMNYLTDDNRRFIQGDCMGDIINECISFNPLIDLVENRGGAKHKEPVNRLDELGYYPLFEYRKHLEPYWLKYFKGNEIIKNIRDMNQLELFT